MSSVIRAKLSWSCGVHLCEHTGNLNWVPSLPFLSWCNLGVMDNWGIHQGMRDSLFLCTFQELEKKILQLMTLFGNSIAAVTHCWTMKLKHNCYGVIFIINHNVGQYKDLWFLGQPCSLIVFPFALHSFWVENILGTCWNCRRSYLFQCYLTYARMWLSI